MLIFLKSTETVFCCRFTNLQFIGIFSYLRITVILSLELVIKIRNKKNRNNQKEISTKCYLGTTEKCGHFKTIGDHKLYATKDLILATKDHLVDLNLLHSYDDGSGITEKELIENRCGIQLIKDSYLCSYHSYL